MRDTAMERTTVTLKKTRLLDLFLPTDSMKGQGKDLFINQIRIDGGADRGSMLILSP